MKLCVLSGTPKTQGLCHSLIERTKAAAIKADVSVDEIRLCDLDLVRCQVCDDGWGECRDENRCRFGADGFDAVTKRIAACDALVMITPVYFGEMSESIKCFTDRLRRCHRNKTDVLYNKQAILIASAGGSGNGLLPCLDQMDRFCRHTGVQIFDWIGVHRWNADYKKEAVYAAVYAMATGRKVQDTV